MFWPFFGSRNRGFRAEDEYQFRIFPCQLYQRILIHNGNPFIYGFHQFGCFSGPLSMTNDVLGPFGSRNRRFSAQDGYQFIIFPGQSYHRILIDSGNQFIYGFHQVCKVFQQLFLKNTIWCHFGTKNAPFLVQFLHLQPFVCHNSTYGDLFCNFIAIVVK